jgi:hypothetical protein
MHAAREFSKQRFVFTDQGDELENSLMKITRYLVREKLGQRGNSTQPIFHKDERGAG